MGIAILQRLNDVRFAHQAVWIAASIVLTVGALLRLRSDGRESHQRGTLVSKRRWLAGRNRSIRSRSRSRGFRLVATGHETIRLAGEPLSPSDETKHFKLIGTTGTGKSTAIGQLLGAALERGDRALVSDPDGVYWKRFGGRYRGDILLNPFESESRRWDLFAEIKNDYDFEQLASALIPQSADAASQEWRAYARTFLVAVIRYCRNRALDLKGCWRLLAVADGDELRVAVAGTPAQPFLEPDNARMFGSIRSVATAAMGAIEYVRDQSARPLSVRDWVRGGRGSLFLPYRAGQIAALRSVISAWIRLALFEAMDKPANSDQRIWFVIDELDALGAIDGLKDALARLRKFGGRCVLGLQSIAQVSGTYGDSDAQTIVENCGNTLVLRCAGSEHGGTSQFASRLIGEREMIRRQIVKSRDRDGMLNRAVRRSTQTSYQRTTEPAVLASELEQLPDLEGYLQTASSAYWHYVRLRR